MSTSPWPAVAALLLNAAVFGLSWWPFRHLNDLGLHSLWTTSLMYLVAATGLLLWRPSAWRRLLGNRWMWLLALAAGLTNACFNWGVTVGEVIRVVLLFYLMPIWAALLARWLLGDPLSTGTVLRMALAVSGAVLVLWQPGLGLPVPASLGDWLGLAGGFFFALTNIVLKRHSAEPTEVRALSMFMGGLVIPGLLAMLLDASLVPWPSWPPTDWLLPALALAIAFVGANLCLQYGAGHLPANVTAVIMLSEVVFASASAIAIGGESAGARTVIGAGLILSAAALAGLSANKPSRPGSA